MACAECIGQVKKVINKKEKPSVARGKKEGLLASEGYIKILFVVFHVPKDGGGGEPSVGTLWKEFNLSDLFITHLSGSAR